MSHYYALGKVPPKRHTQFRKPDGGLYAEELISTEGFSNVYSLVYHVHPPTLVKEVGEAYSVAPEIAIAKNLKHRSFLGFRAASKGNFLESRVPLFVNQDVLVGVFAPDQNSDLFYKNALCDEVLFVHEGTGLLKTIFGSIAFRPGDYLVIPRGTIYQMRIDSADSRFLYVESASPVVTPQRYRNDFGQLLEHSPFCERDLRKPSDLETFDQMGDFKVLIKKEGMIYPYLYGSHPFDAIGWDGFLYPYAFSIHDFEPITGRVHQPPPVHQTFAAAGFVICSFCPRLYDYHPLAIPAPYFHSNVDSDEILYYAEGEFMSRKHVERGMFSFHPMGIPHGPHPGAIEKSIGKKETAELAVMIDTFRPLQITRQALQIEDPNYHLSWLP